MEDGTTAHQVSMQLPHLRRETVPVTSAHRRRFSSKGPQLSDDFVDRLLVREPDYNPELAYALAVISGWSYADAKTLARKIPYYGLPSGSIDEIIVVNPAMFIVASAFLYRSECGRVGILSFRGTEPDNAISWLTDTDVMQRRFGDGSVHQGFYTNLRAVWDEIEDKLAVAMQAQGSNGNQQKPAPLQQLYITGHSLGGAMAVLAAAKLSLDGSPELKNALQAVYTFGQPAVGDETFANQFAPKFGERLYRHNYRADLVPRLPPRWGTRYVHFGQERATGAVEQAWKRTTAPTKQVRAIVPALFAAGVSFVTRRLPPLANLALHASIDDHSPSRYIEASRSALLMG